jgi:hypothetical protein
MTTEIDYKEFQTMLNSHSPEEQFTEDEAAEAYHNLTEFFMVLVQINEREKIVPVEGALEPEPRNK